MSKILLCTLLLSLGAFHANAARFSGAYLLELCKRDEAGKEVVKGGHTACQAYIAGIMDYQKLLRSLDTSPSIDFCVPNDVPLGRLQDHVWAYLEKNAANDGFIAAPAVAIALFEAYPCESEH